jgi:hypothetical protein
MKISVDELIDLQNRTNGALQDAYKQGIKEEAEKPLPDNFFDAILDYAKKSGTLIDYHKSSSKQDGCNWIQVKPTREGSRSIEYVEISFDNNLTEINYIGAKKK